MPDDARPPDPDRDLHRWARSVSWPLGINPFTASLPELLRLVEWLEATYGRRPPPPDESPSED